MDVLHRASWVIPVVAPPLQDGAVLVRDGQIVEIGPWQTMDNSLCEVIDHGLGILMPGLINAHTHLELSHCQASGRYEKPGDMVRWIGDLLRFRKNYAGDDVAQVANQCLLEMADSGIDLVVDIGNDPSFSRKHSQTKVLFFHELLGLSENSYIFMTNLRDTVSGDYTCHAPYSTNLQLLLETKAHTRRHQTLLPIHVAESQAEMDFIRTGEGHFKTFIQDLGTWDDSFQVPGGSPLAYLAEQNLVDERTLCVHCVHVDAADIDLLVQHQAKVCLCLGSNTYLGVGIPPVMEMIQAGLRPCLGTDSRASNPHVSIWREMNIMHEKFANLSGEQIVAMATINGAMALGLPEYGSLKSGGVSMIFVEYDGALPLDFLSFDSNLKKVTRCM